MVITLNNFRPVATLHKLFERRLLTLSSVQGSLEPPLSAKTLSGYFQTEIVKKHWDRPALICRQEIPRAHGGPMSKNMGVDSHLAWDFGEFDRHNHALARGLLSMGVKKGDRVGVIMGNNSAYAMLQWACASIGAILVTINPAYRFLELVNTLKLVGVKHLFVVPSIRSSEYVRMLSQGFPDMRSARPGEIQLAELPELRNFVVVDNLEAHKTGFERLHIKSMVDWREILMWQGDTRLDEMQKDIESSNRKDDVINLQFTRCIICFGKDAKLTEGSGTTGSPKAVSLTHSNLLNNALSISRCMYFTEKDILCNVPPLFHCFDESAHSFNLTKPNFLSKRLVLGNLAAWSRGACIVYPSEIYNPQAIVDAVIAERCTALHGVPTHFLGVLSEVERRRLAGHNVDFSRLRTGIAAGSPIPIALMQSLISKLNLVDLTNAFGMSTLMCLEMLNDALKMQSPVSFQTTPADPILKRVETVGRVQPHVKAKVVDLEGNIVPIGTPGEVHIAGYLLQKGYWEDEEQTNSVMKKDEEGTLWMHTGDEGIMDEDGYLKIVGRIKDIIIRGGENLFPVQIENALTADPAIREAAAVSVPDSKYGEVVGAWIVREPGTKQSREDVRCTVVDRMNPQNAPAWVWFLGEDGTPDELPKTASGKVMKHILRNWSKKLVANCVGEVNGRKNIV